MPNLTVARLMQLLHLDNIPIPGDRVRITNNARDKTIVGRTGRIDRITNIQVILDTDETDPEGRSVNITPQSLEVLPPNS